MLHHGCTLIREIHSESKQRVGDVLDVVEKTQRGVLQLVRRVAGHTDELVEESYGAIEELLLGLLRTAHTTATDATGIVARATESWLGSRPAPARAA